MEILDLADGAGERDPELAQDLAPVDLVVGDAVELLLEVGGEVVFDVARKEAFQERDDNPPAVLRHQPALVDADVFAVLEHLQDRGIGRGTADAELFHALDEGRLRIARRRLSEVLGRGDVFLGERLARAHRRQPARLLVLGVVVAALLVELEEAVELEDAAGRPQLQHAGGDLGGDIDGGALELGQLHLARYRTLPDQLVELRLVGIELAAYVARASRHVGRADRLVGFLGILRLGLIAARPVRNIGLAVFRADEGADRGDRLVGDLHAVGTHIGDEADGIAADVDALVEALRDPHGVGRRKAELAARLLLQRRGGERRIGIAPRRPRLDVGDGEGRRLQRLLEGFRIGARADVEPLDLLPVGADEARLEGLRPRGRERCHQRPVFAGDELFDLELAVADEP